jgi:hypothetical protein
MKLLLKVKPVGKHKDRVKGTGRHHAFDIACESVTT